jgi:hypothetical protein
MTLSFLTFAFFFGFLLLYKGIGKIAVGSGLFWLVVGVVCFGGVWVVVKMYLQ